MAISHNLDIQTSLSISEIQQLLLNSNLGLELIEADTEYNNNSLYGIGISVTYHRESKLAKKVTFEDFGFISDISIGFHMLRNESETAGMETTARILSVLLSQIKGDAVFFLNSDYLVFKRLKSNLIVYKEISEWLISELNKENIQYNLETSEYAEMFE